MNLFTFSYHNTLYFRNLPLLFRQSHPFYNQKTRNSLCKIFSKETYPINDLHQTRKVAKIVNLRSLRIHSYSVIENYNNKGLLLK